MRGTRVAIRFIATAGTLALASCGRHAATQEPAASAGSTQHAHWSYEGETGPAAWGTMSPEFVACAEGATQSPIDIASASVASAPASVTMQYGRASMSIDHHEHVTDVIDNGHTIQVNCGGAGSVTIGGKAFALAQFHFHSPSEHTVDGKSYPMEMHLVHKSADDSLAVLGVLIEEGKPNAAFDSVWAHLPAEAGQEVRLPDVIVDVDHLLPAKREFYRYDGSLTTPPCSEGVKWLVMKTPIALSHDQIAKFRAIIHDNNRPTQALKNRVVAVQPMAGTP
jgi:carbonic anhydrase